MNNNKKKIKSMSKRQLRVGASIRYLLAKSLVPRLMRNDILAGALITITRVQMSSNLKNAKVFFIVGQCIRIDLNVILNALTTETPNLKSIIRNRMVLKFIPNLCFCYDKIFEETYKVHKIINKSYEI